MSQFPNIIANIRLRLRAFLIIIQVYLSKMISIFEGQQGDAVKLHFVHSIRGLQEFSQSLL